MTESALHKNISNDQIEIPGYIPIRNDLTDNDSHGGVLIYHKADLAVKYRLDIQNYKNTLVLELSISQKKVFVVLVYRKFGRSTEEFNIFQEKLDEVFNKIDLENPYCLITGGL